MPKKGYKQTREHRLNTTKALTGQQKSIKTRKKISIALSDKKHPMYGMYDDAHQSWKGNNICCNRLHRWIEQHLGQPTKCEHCKKDNLTGQQINWANKDHKYKRNLKDWLRLCAKCHAKYDKANGLRY